MTPAKIERAEGGHTAGPWFAVPYGDGDDTVICRDEAGNKRIAFMAVPGSRDEQERRKAWAEIKANARLIAAAPDLLEALERAAQNIDAMAKALQSEQLFAAGNRAAGWAEDAQRATAKARGAV